MGFAKRLLQEEQARRYELSSDAVCIECFVDGGIKAFIGGNADEHECSICGVVSDKPIASPANAVIEFSLEKLGRHYEDANESAPWDGGEGGWQVRTYTMYDLVYDKLEEIGPSETLDWLYSKLKDDIEYCDRDWQILNPSQALEYSWQAFARSVKHITRFLFFPKAESEITGEPFMVPPAEMLEALGDAIRSGGLVQRVPAGTRVYRARCHEAGKCYTTPEALGPPPVEFAKTAGRMNAPGIVVFYGTEEKETAVVEAAGGHTRFSVGTFETLVDLSVVDLTILPPVPSIFEGGDRDSLLFLRHFAEEVSQPFEPDVEIHIEYVPTQVVSEYLRHRFRGSHGEAIRGMVYGSAKRPGTKNLAIFIESAEVEGVLVKSWQKKDSLLRLLTAEEIDTAKEQPLAEV